MALAGPRGSGMTIDLDGAQREANTFLAGVPLDPTEIIGKMVEIIAELREARAEIARHHRDFARWEEMANRGAAALAENERLRELLTWHATPQFEEDHAPKAEDPATCFTCQEPWPCMTQKAWTALHPEEPSDDC